MHVGVDVSRDARRSVGPSPPLEIARCSTSRSVTPYSTRWRVAQVTGTREAPHIQRLSLEIKEKIVCFIVALVIGSSLLDSGVRAHP